jgi:CDP-ribitol ribitolphosphotransferase
MRFLASLAIALAQTLYAAFLLFLPARHKVVMLSRQSNRPSRDFTMLAAELQRRDPQLEVVIRCRFIEGSLAARALYVSDVIEQMYHLATSRVCIVDGYIVPVSVLSHRPGLTVIQMWHALGAIKHFGYQSLDRLGGRSSRVARAMRMHRNYDVVLCGGPSTVPVFSAAFNTPAEKVLPLGLPRVDFLADKGAVHTETTDRLTAFFPRLADDSKRRVLYAPTFRKRGATGYSSVLAAFDPERFTLIVKPHDLEVAALDSPHIVDATGTDILDLLHICDAVITDYSGVAFEAAAADVPTYYYVYDLDAYKADQGLNLDPLAQFGEDASRDIAPLVERIAAGRRDTAASERFRFDFVPACESKCTNTIAELVLEKTARR